MRRSGFAPKAALETKKELELELELELAAQYQSNGLSWSGKHFTCRFVGPRLTPNTFPLSEVSVLVAHRTSRISVLWSLNGVLLL